MDEIETNSAKIPGPDALASEPGFSSKRTEGAVSRAHGWLQESPAIALAAWVHQLPWPERARRRVGEITASLVASPRSGSRRAGRATRKPGMSPQLARRAGAPEREKQELLAVIVSKKTEVVSFLKAKMKRQVPETSSVS